MTSTENTARRSAGEGAAGTGDLARQVLERLGAGVAMVSGDGTVTWANAALAALHGLAVDEIVGHPVVLLHGAEDNPYDHPDALRVVNHPPSVYEFEREVRSRRVRYRLTLLETGNDPDGSAGAEGSDGSDGSDGNGSVGDGSAGVTRRFLLECSSVPDGPLVVPGPVAEVAVDGGGRILAANAAFADLTGEALARLRGRRLGELVHPRDLEALDVVLAGPRASTEEVTTTVEVRLTRADGRPAWVELGVAAAGRPDAVVVVAADVTDRKRDELLLQEVFDSSPVPYALLGPDGAVASTNPAWRARFGPAPPGRRHLGDLLDEEARAELAGALSTASSRAGGGFELHAIPTDADGQPFAARLRATALHDLSGRLERLLVSVDDLTEHALEVELARRGGQRARALIDQLDHAVTTHDASGAVREVNLGAHRLFGAGATDLVGERTLPSWWQPRRVDGSPLPADEHPALVVVRGPVSHAEAVVGLTVDGAARWYAVRARALLDDTHRRCVGAVCSYSEVTDLQGALDVRGAGEAALHDAFDALPVAVYEAGEDLSVRRASRVWRELFPRAGASPVDVLSLVHRDDRRAAAAAFDDVAARRDSVRFHHRLARPDEPVATWVDHHLAPLLDGGGEVRGFVGTVIPVPDWVAQSERTRRLLRLVETTNDLVGEYELATRTVTYLNPRAIELFEADERRLDRLHLADLYSPEAAAIFASEIWPALRAQDQWEGELPMVTAAGTVIQVQQWITAERDASGRIVRLVAAGHDVTDRSQREAELALRATHDPLTGLPNRALLLEHLEGSLGRARRGGHLVALVFLDLDRFKSVNDRYGHEAGDTLLVQAANRLTSVVRPHDLVARLGGDEFVVLCDGVDDKAHALAVANRVATVIGGRPFHLGATAVRTTASVGVALSCGDDHPEALLRDADAAMYRAKDFGRCRIELFDETMRSRASSRVQLAEELASAVASGAIAVHYQPSVDLHDGEIRSVEALARWDHPTRGRLSPADFIDVAEETGLMVDIGQDVLRQAAARARTWELRFGERAPTVHVNLSSRQIADERLLELVTDALTESGLRPSLLCLELTESLLLDRTEEAVATVEALKAMGIRLAIDDFGTGYSSLAYLSRLPVDVVKVDRSFVTGLDPAREDASVVAAAIITLAHALGMSTIAEGVTTVAQLAELHRLGCDAAQGYYFAAPLPAEEIDEHLARRLSGPTEPSPEEDRLRPAAAGLRSGPQA